MRVMVAFGTRPEAIKMAPVVKALRAHSGFQTTVVVTGQHRDMLQQALRVFDVVPDVDLELMQPDQHLSSLTSSAVSALADAIRHHRPGLLLVHGDTTTTLAAALAGFYAKVPVAHIEAGLRSGNLQEPWPEEMNRRVCTTLSTLHFAPTERARGNLLAEGVMDSSIEVTGNTAVDALLMADKMLRTNPSLMRSVREGFPQLQTGKRLVLVTAHRRENFGPRFEAILSALQSIAGRDDVQIVYPVHPNPNVSDPARRALGDVDNVLLVPPQDYLPFVYLMQQAHLILTDSGGLQEEAPSLDRPVLVMREATERPEVIATGAARLVGTNTERIVQAVAELLDFPHVHESMSRADNPYGDGRSSDRIVQALAERYHVP